MAAGDVPITVCGNVVDQPTLRYTSAGQAVASFRVASTPRVSQPDGTWVGGDALFLDCNVWRQAAENVAESVTRGMRVVVTGRLKQRSYEAKDGGKRTVYEIEADEVGVSLRNATAKVGRLARTSAPPAGTGAAATGDDPRASKQGAALNGNPPF